jgi:hypothetical protein
MMGLSRTAKFYRDNPESYKKKLKKARTHPVWGEQTERRKKKNRESERERYKKRKEGKAGEIKNKHYDHKQKKFIPAKENLAQAEKSRLKGSKRASRKIGKAIKKAVKSMKS